ncbi:aminodeoxychorismate/anthranilate synthase component II [Enterococcus entomosocium]|uniref:aminodeoxychorismate/anthranilate synthase component II n=1 Tax=Enterococcus entomosocium TaxID=3034352 RepID=UPI003D6B2255
MILLVDNYDSFTYNLVQQCPADTIVLRNDDPELFIVAKEADAIIFSPGPGRPEEAEFMISLIKTYQDNKPLLGICLGHQAIGEAFGAKVVQAPAIMHGKQSTLTYQKKGVFETYLGDMTVMRYHSLVIEPATLSAEFEVLAETEGIIMAIQHREKPIVGLQFHPESMGTNEGAFFIEQFLKLVSDNTEKTQDEKRRNL